MTLLNIVRTFAIALIAMLVNEQLRKAKFPFDKRFILTFVITISWLLFVIGFTNTLFDAFPALEQGFNNMTGYKGA